MLQCPLPIRDYDVVTLGHGGGGRLSQQLISSMLVPAFDNPVLRELHDGAVLPWSAGRLAMSTDTFVVSPPFFPGGDIGLLAVHGTTNDLAMCGARPLHLSVGLILEEGLPMKDLWRILVSIRAACDAIGVQVVTGDTKVVERGKGDGIFINTTGVGAVVDGIDVRPTRVRPGDRVLLSGPIGEHGVAIMALRAGLSLSGDLKSDTAALWPLVKAMLDAGGTHVHALRDATRGGVASVTNEIADSAGVGLVLQETAIPVGDTVRGACELLGLDPLYVANEGRLVAFVAPQAADAVLAAMRGAPQGAGAVDVGEVVADPVGTVLLRGAFGGTRVVDVLSGEQLPRIC